jgi:hypothetical protein
MSDKARETRKKHWREGRAARAEGVKIDADPHKAGTLASVFWQHGWKSVTGRGGKLWARAEAALAKS